MKQAAMARRGHSIRGLTLIELMVSITIGLVLMIAVTSAYLGSSAASSTAEAQGRMNEDAQAALSILSQQIHMAGDNPRRPNYTEANRSNPIFTTGTYIVRGCDGNFSDVTTAGSIAALTCTAGTTDSIAISYEADPKNTVATTAGVATDCLGAGLTTQTANVNVWDGVTMPPAAGTTSQAVTFTVADNRFYIKSITGPAPANEQIPSLHCMGNGGGTEQPLVENIEDLQFVYGTAPATGTLTVAGYLNATKVETEATLAALADIPKQWGRVVTVKVCVLVRSEKSVAVDSESAKYFKCFADTSQNANLSTAPDLRLRRAYYSTVVMRNRVLP